MHDVADVTVAQNSGDRFGVAQVGEREAVALDRLGVPFA